MENVSYMKIEVLGVVNVIVNVLKRCSYNNRGYCKYQNGCKYIHYEQVCEKFLRDGKCGMEQNSQQRHPQICKYWIRHSQGCKRNEL